MRSDWTPEAEARLKTVYPQMVDCPLPTIHSKIEFFGKTYTTTDLSNEIGNENPTFKGHQRTVVWQHLTHEETQKFGLTNPPYSYEVMAFTMCGHTSTHCDSISHVVPEDGARPIDQTPINWHMTPGIWLDFRNKESNTYITKAEIEAQMDKEGLSIKPSSVFLFCSGQYKKYDSPFGYIKDYPGIDEEASHWLADSGVIAIGADAFSIDSYYEVSTRMVQPAHIMCRERGILNIESLRNIDLIPKREFFFVGLPLKIKNGCGSPIRAVAITEND